MGCISERIHYKNELLKLRLIEAENNIAMVADLKTIHPRIDMPVGFTIQKATSPGQIQKVWRNVSGSIWYISGRLLMFKHTIIKFLL